MNPFSRTVAGVVAAALFTVSVAAPADARPRGRYYHHHNDVDAGDIIAGIAIIGGIAAIASAASRNRSETSYSRDGNPYRVVVNSCGYEADEAYGRGNVRVTDVEQIDRDTFRVTGMVERGGGYFGREEPAYEEEASDESSAVIGQERYYDPEARAAERAEQQRGDDSFAFSCTALGNGRIVDFAANDY